LEDKDGVAWGEETSQEYINKNNFLYSTQAENSSSRSRQGKLVIISGVVLQATSEGYGRHCCSVGRLQ
jgi:hypothetical protein